MAKPKPSPKPVKPIKPGGRVRMKMSSSYIPASKMTAKPKPTSATKRNPRAQ